MKIIIQRKDQRTIVLRAPDMTPESLVDLLTLLARTFHFIGDWLPQYLAPEVVRGLAEWRACIAARGDYHDVELLDRRVAHVLRAIGVATTDLECDVEELPDLWAAGVA